MEELLNKIFQEVKDIKESMVTKKYLEERLTEFATKKDLEERLVEFATKDDLKNFATKDDLKNFATKDDLKNFATKDDLKNFATKSDIRMLLHEINELKFIINGLAEDIAMLDLRTRSLVTYPKKKTASL